MTAPFTPPDVRPSWTFEGQGDLGAASEGLKQVLGALAKQQAQQEAMQQRDFENQQAQMRLQSQLSNDQLQMEQAKLQMQAIKVANEERKREHELKVGQGQAVKGALANRVADAEADTSGMDMGAVQAILGSPDEAALNTMQNINAAGWLQPIPAVADWLNTGGQTIGVDRQGREMARFQNTMDPGTRGAIRAGQGGGAGGADTVTNQTVLKQWVNEGDMARKLVLDVPTLLTQGRMALKASKWAGATAEFKTLATKYLSDFGLIDPNGDAAQKAAQAEQYVSVGGFSATNLLMSGRFGDARSLSDKDLQRALAMAGADMKLTPGTIKLMSALNLWNSASSLEMAAQNAADRMGSRPKGVTEAAWRSTVGDPVKFRAAAQQLRQQAKAVFSSYENDIKSGRAQTPNVPFKVGK